MTTLQKTMVAATFVAAVSLGYETVRIARLNREHRALLVQQEQLTRERDQALLHLRRATHAAPRLPAPAVQPSALPTTSSADSASTNFLERMMAGDVPKLTSEQIEKYLKETHGSPASLLAAARLTGDKSYLLQAMTTFPNDPHVAFDAVFLSGISNEVRREWVDKFKQNAPDNSLASYASALEYFKAGQTDQAVQELLAASAKPQFQDYFWDQVQNAEEAWRASGYPELDTRWLAMSQGLLPHLAQMKQLNQNIVDLAKAYRQAGDNASAHAALEYDIQLGERLTQRANDQLITQLVGIAIQRNALGELDPNSPYGTTDLTIAQRLDQLKQFREQARNLNQQLEPILPMLSPQDFITWADRRRAFGELNAMQWIINKYGNQSTGSP